MRFIFMSLAALSIVACDNDDTAAEIPDDAIFDADGDGVESDVDCDDRSASTHPGAVEICDSIDNNCNGLVDEDPIDGSTWYVDYDGDGYGSDTFVESFCSTPAAGYAKNADDCNDLEARSYPGNREVCDGVDNDCDDAVDNDPVDQVTWYVDSDGDSFGDPGISVVACDRPADEYVTNGDDCDDLNGDLNPATRWFPDMDNDGFGQPFFSVAACEPPPNHVRSDTDCADDNPDAYPGAATRDVLTLCTIDLDGDGFGDADPAQGIDPGTDCDDTRETSNPVGVEYCDELDNDCNGVVDDDYARDTSLFYIDADADGFGFFDESDSSTDPRSSCSAPDGYTDNFDDCNDGTPLAAPGLLELCADAFDNDCDGQVNNQCIYFIEDDAGSTITGNDGEFGARISRGDISNDGTADTLVTASFQSDEASSAGAAYIYLGDIADGSDLDTTGANITVFSESSFDYMGTAADMTGDINDDGVTDLIIGAYGDDTTDSSAGAVWVFYGPFTAGTELYDSDADLTITGDTSFDYVGRFVARAADVDGDGADELVVGAYQDDDGGTNAGMLALYRTPTDTALGLADADIQIIGSASYGNVGYSFAPAGDVNGDGDDDFMYGEIGEERAYILAGPLTAGAYDADDAIVTFDDSANLSDRGGSNLAYGDFNGDGYNDYVIGASYDDFGGSSAGAVYIFNGSMTGFSANVETSSADTRIVEISTFAYLGNELNSIVVADVDDDGNDDLMLTSYSHDSYASNAGGMVLFNGPIDSGDLDVADFDKVVLSTTAGAELGIHMGLDDVDGDDELDLLISAPEAEAGSGSTYILYSF